MYANINTAQDIMHFIMYVIVAVILPVVTSFAKSYWEAKKVQTVIVTDNAEIDHTIKYVISLIVDAVAFTNQTYVNDLKEAAADNKLTPEEMKIAYQKTFQRVKDLLPEATRKVLSSAYGDVDLWIQTEIEAIIHAK